MCGVIGFAIKNVEYEDFSLIRKIFIESMIRGKHATGVSFFNGEKVVTIKEPVPADKFLENNDPKDWVYNGNIICIGHVRYSTSDLKDNQPIATDSLSICHNGVITQETPENWKNNFGYDTTTRNDSELILRCLENKEIPFKVFSGASMAVATLDDMGIINFFRNGQRPLHYSFLFNKDGVDLTRRGVIITSTQDIPYRCNIPHFHTFGTSIQSEYVVKDFDVYIKKTYITKEKDLQ
jgi:glutamine phosphoribosylpyrophosphate amidotransferase